MLNQQELKENQEEQVNQLLGLIYALLALAVIVSLFGIANTLALSIHERTRELGMLRAIGMSRRQVRTMIRYEAVITALIGAILGMVLGVIFAALIAQPLKDEGFTLSYPVGTLIVLLVLAALAGVAGGDRPGPTRLTPRRARGPAVRVERRPLRGASALGGASGGEAHAQGPGRLQHRRPRRARERGQVGEAVDQPRVAAQRDLDARLAHPRRVLLALVAQRVEAGGGDVGGRQAARGRGRAGPRRSGS